VHKTRGGGRQLVSPFDGTFYHESHQNRRRMSQGRTYHQNERLCHLTRSKAFFFISGMAPGRSDHLFRRIFFMPQGGIFLSNGYIF
jgi:hypothetical protein